MVAKRKIVGIEQRGNFRMETGWVCSECDDVWEYFRYDSVVVLNSCV